MATISQELEELRNIIDQRDREVLEMSVNLKEMSMSFASDPERSDLKINEKMLTDLDRSTSEIEHLRRCLQDSVPKSELERVQDELLRSTQKISRMQNLISRMQGLMDVLIERIEILMQNLSPAGRGTPEPKHAVIDLCSAQINRLQFCIDSISKPGQIDAQDNKLIVIHDKRKEAMTSSSAIRVPFASTTASTGQPTIRAHSSKLSIV